MRFVKLTLENFKVFYGKQTIDLNNSSNNNKNVILIGGLNGSGKTTILTAVQIILFGKGNMSDSEFKNSLNGTLNQRFLEEGGNIANLSLTIESDGKFYTLYAKLHYSSNNVFNMLERKMIFEHSRMRLFENEIQTFINKNIPLEASLFFLFDGEKIQEIVDKQEDDSLKKSIQNIIALDFYKKALHDIGKARDIIEREYNKSVSHKTFKNVAREKEEVKEKLEINEQKIKVLEERYQMENEELIKIKNRRDKKIQKYYNSKESIVKKITRLEEAFKINKDKIENYAKEALPILILHPIIKEVQERIKQETTYQQRKQKIELTFKQFDDFMEEFINGIDFLELNDNEKKLLFQYGRKVWKKTNNIFLEEPEYIEILHDLNVKDKKILESIKFDNFNILSVISEQNEIIKKIDYLENMVKNAPEAEDFSKEEELIDNLTKTLGEYSIRIKALRAKSLKFKSELSRLEKKFNEIKKQINANITLERELDLANRVYGAAKNFVEQVTVYKANQIKEDFEYIINKLLRKTNDFSKIDFDISTYRIKIYDHNGTLLKLKNRSAGEKQIIALSLIWALTKNAAIDLPYIIDTPLGRLDSIHRKNLIDYYFPHLSNQIIILSTDTEVNFEFNNAIMEHVCKSYRLDYDEILRCSFIKEGYFNFN